MSFHKKSFQYGDHTVTLETGEIARQASASVIVSMGDTVVLVTAVVEKNAAEERDFFPLRVDYQEKSYAAGKVPGGYFKREGRPSEKEILTARLIDRPVRPLFPADFVQEVQIVATVMSQDPEIDADIPSLIGASAALSLSGIPFQGPIGAARVAYKDGLFIVNPKMSELNGSKLDLVVAGTKSAVLMVESEAQELSEEIMLSAVVFGHEQAKIAIQAIEELVKEVNPPAFVWQPKVLDQVLLDAVEAKAGQAINQAYMIAGKLERKARLDEIKAELVQQFCCVEPAGTAAPSEAQIQKIFGQLEEKIVRSRILGAEPRIDGRDLRTVRPIRIKLGFLPRTHGSALFTRGETQALVVTTLGTGRDAQMVDALLESDSKDCFMLHYNFPPYSVGEIGQIGSPKRREIGHGRLAKRAMKAVLPNQEEFPYVIRIVSEITESNGSSSMATVCGASLSMMEAGVPLKKPVAGIAMGLIKEGERFSVLTDILGDEDHLGDMDFKVAGTSDGITALQMDIKIDGITKEIMEKALQQARDARMHILGEMAKVIEMPRQEVSNFAPRIITMRIPRDKIRDVIGKGGATIRGIIEETGVEIDISDDGEVKIAAVELAAGEEAKRRIEALTAEVEVDQIYEGTVVKLADFGAFVTLQPSGKDGLVHISQIAATRVNQVSDYLKEGQAVRVKVIEIDKQGRIKLSMKDLA